MNKLLSILLLVVMLVVAFGSVTAEPTGWVYTYYPGQRLMYLDDTGGRWKLEYLWLGSQYGFPFAHIQMSHYYTYNQQWQVTRTFDLYDGAVSSEDTWEPKVQYLHTYGDLIIVSSTHSKIALVYEIMIPFALYASDGQYD